LVRGDACYLVIQEKIREEKTKGKKNMKKEDN